MSRHYYAVYWPYGVNTFNFDHEPIGTVVPFDTTKARDAYVAADRFDGNFHRSVPDYRLLRKMMLGALREFRSLDSKGYEGWLWMASSMSLLVMRTRRCSMLMRSCVMTCSVTLIRGMRECHGNIEIVG